MSQSEFRAIICHLYKAREKTARVQSGIGQFSSFSLVEKLSRNFEANTKRSRYYFRHSFETYSIQWMVINPVESTVHPMNY